MADDDAVVVPGWAKASVVVPASDTAITAAANSGAAILVRMVIPLDYAWPVFPDHAFFCFFRGLEVRSAVLFSEWLA
ncbi:MAG TPA: hypothetical protein VIS06_21150, partial [Mycobacteriales bacterium]